MLNISSKIHWKFFLENIKSIILVTTEPNSTGYTYIHKRNKKKKHEKEIKKMYINVTNLIQ